MEFLPADVKQKILDYYWALNSPYTRKLTNFRTFFMTTVSLRRSQRAKVRVILSPRMRETDLKCLHRAYRFLVNIHKIQHYWNASAIVNNNTIAQYLANQCFGPFKTERQEEKWVGRIQTAWPHVGVWRVRTRLSRGLDTQLYTYELTEQGAARRIQFANRLYKMRKRFREYTKMLNDEILSQLTR